MVTERPRMHRFRTAASVAALAILVSSGIACKQGLGQRCEIDSDCDDGLTCTVMGTASDPAGGICVGSGTTTGTGGTGGDDGAGGTGGSGGGAADNPGGTNGGAGGCAMTLTATTRGRGVIVAIVYVLVLAGFVIRRRVSRRDR